MTEIFRDPRYLVPLGILLAVIVVSAALVYDGRTAQSSAPAPDAATVVDYRRIVDLGRLRDAAVEYGRKHAELPSTSDEIVPLCALPGDAGCAFRDVAPDLPVDDGQLPYWYQSDGRSYFLFIARANKHGDTRDCPPVLPAPLSSGPVMCVRGGR
ncbi:MAG TPA: hypothetical protein VNM91_10585 [Dehalococcoidia bacterium]|nr:hypothetical protein [Dehalococcoidia bacterium]